MFNNYDNVIWVELNCYCDYIDPTSIILMVVIWRWDDDNESRWEIVISQMNLNDKKSGYVRELNVIVCSTGMNSKWKRLHVNSILSPVRLDCLKSEEGT